jgi:hypothetical protein
MEKIDDNYGAINSIVDNTSSIYVKDSNGTEYLFEVNPLELKEDEIQKALQEVDKKIWFINYKTAVRQPTDREIQQALENGEILKASINGTIIDNYGTIHSIYLDKKENIYKIRINNLINYLSKSPNFKPLSSEIIDFIQASEDPMAIARNFRESTTLIFEHFTKNINTLNETIKRILSTVEEQNNRILNLERLMGVAREG